MLHGMRRNSTRLVLMMPAFFKSHLVNVPYDDNKQTHSNARHSSNWSNIGIEPDMIKINSTKQSRKRVLYIFKILCTDDYNHSHSWGYESYIKTKE